MSNAQFHLHHYPKQEALADLLIHQIRKEGQNDPFYKSRVLVRNQGMATWLNRRLATQEHAGIAMQIDYPQPNSFLQTILNNPSVDPEVLKWQIYQTLPNLLDRPSFSSVQHYLNAPGDDATDKALKRYQLSGMLSGLFDKYLLYRPDWINAWEDNQKPSDISSGSSESELWQRELWQSIHRDGQANWSQTIQNKEAFDIPEGKYQALHVFGISNFAPVYVSFLYQLSQIIPVHIYWMNPVEATEGYWEHSPTARQWLLANEFDTPEILQDFNPLLASFGRLGREFIHTLYGGDNYDFEVQDPDWQTQSPVIKSPSTNLQLLQSSIYDNLPQQNNTAPEDTTISIHSCHSPLRELETLKTYLLTLAESAELDTDDVLVMCPDINAYAPAIQSVFGDHHDEGQKNLRISIRDQAVPSERPSIVALLSLFNLHTSRFTNQEALSLLSTPNILSRFDLTESDLSTIRDWIMANGIRWGFDDAHASKVASNTTESPWTWRSGIDRMLLGYAMPNPSKVTLWNDILPFHEIESGNAAILGSLCQFVQWCDTIRTALLEPRPLDEWVRLTKEWISKGFDPNHERHDELQVLDNILDQIKDQSALLSENLPVEVFAEHLQNLLEGASSTKVFLNGAMTFCEMKPMRAIPSNIICLLGMNHDTFPRRSTDQQFDLTRNNRKMGDRSTRDDDTYSFLEAILSARESLFISYIGTSIKDGKERPPSTALQTLIGYVPGLDQQVKKEKLHAYDPSYFQEKKPTSHDPALLKAAKVMVSGETSATLTHKLSISGASELTSIDINTLVSALNKPAQYFLKNTIHARSTYKGSPLEENEVIAIDGLSGYHIKSQFLEHRKLDTQQIKAWKQDGSIPVGELGNQAVETKLAELRDKIDQVPTSTPMPIAITINGLTITGNVPIEEAREDGKTQILTIDASSGQANTQLRTWIYQLLASEQSASPVASSLYFVNAKKLRLLPITATEDYSQHLADLIELFREISTKPVAHFPRSAAAYCGEEQKDDESDDEFNRRRQNKALVQWNPSDFSPGKTESQDESIKCIFGSQSLFDDLENDTFTDQFIEYTERIWPPLIQSRQKPSIVK